MRTQILDALLETVVDKAQVAPHAVQAFIGEYLKILIAERFSAEEIDYFKQKAALILYTHVHVPEVEAHSSPTLLQ